jgi:rhamnulose-1-phosphate aldolase
MWQKGWDERNGGNISLQLTSEDVAPYQNQLNDGRIINLSEELPALSGQFFLVTGTGKFFRNVEMAPEDSLGLVQIAPDGKSIRIRWGYTDGGNPTSELSSHFKSHVIRQRVTNGADRVVMHCHATNLIALTYVLKLDAASVTRALWEMSTECLVVFPDGVGILPWIVPGTDVIGEATAETMAKHSIVIWPFHGVFGTGPTLDDAFGLIDTAEKAAEILVKVLSMGGMRHSLTTQNLRDLAVRFNVKPMPEALEVKDWIQR